MILCHKSYEFKATADDAGVFSGYASVFGEVDSQNDIVARGAFAASIERWKAKGRMPGMFWQHDSYEPIGVWESIIEDLNGLPVEGRLLIEDIQRAKQAHSLMKRGGLSGLSIGYVLKKSEKDDDTGITTLTEIDLWEVSLVTFPALDSARVDSVKNYHDLRPAERDRAWEIVRAHAVGVETERDFERFLRDAGFSKRDAVAITGHGYRAAMRRESAVDAQIAALRDAAQTLRF